MLLLVGLGYKIYTNKRLLILKLGYSHLICCQVPKNIFFIIKKTLLQTSSINYEPLQQFNAMLKTFKALDIYKGKGFYNLSQSRQTKLGKIWQR